MDFYVTPLISDGAVLQREKDILIRGGGKSGAEVKAELSEEASGCGEKKFHRRGRVCEDGTWRLMFEPLPAGGPYRLICTSESQSLEIKDIWIGDVWLLAGQSNMQLPMERVKYRFPEEYRKGASTLIRQFAVPIEWDFESPRTELDGGEWKNAVGEATAFFSAVGFFFGQKLFEKYQIPIGLILTAVGGTPIQAWMGRESLLDFPNEINKTEICRTPGYVEMVQRQNEERIGNWWRKLDKNDVGIKEKWLAGQDGNVWKKVGLCESWENIPELKTPGAVWLRKQVDIIPERAGVPVRVSLGTIKDADFLYVNGVVAGNTGYRYPPREYELKGLMSGRNIIVIRVVAVHGTGGFTIGKRHVILWEDGFEIDISDDWEYCRGAYMEELAEQTFFERKPMGMYQGMIAPLHDFPIQGICWYQGEMNADDYGEYPGYFSRMVSDWRKRWGEESVPVFFVQLPNYDLEDAGNWVRFREMQRGLTAIPNSAMVVTIDCGEDNDLHPTDKKTVGERLALAAFQNVYREPGCWLSPLFAYAKTVQGGLELYFCHAKGGLETLDGRAPDGFEYIYVREPARDGANRVEGKVREEEDDGIMQTKIMARARIEGECVIVQWPDYVGKKPAALVYAWSNHPVNANLCNRKKLPASPFLCRL